MQNSGAKPIDSATPKRKRNRKRVLTRYVGIKFPVPEAQALQAYAARQGQTMSHVIRMVLRPHLKVLLSRCIR
jgi:hypothetical protein